VIYSTHSPALLNVTRLDELVFVEHLADTGTRTLQPDPVSADEDFRVMTEFDAARSELFLARAAVLVEGLTEKLVLPFVFSALGYDVDRKAISIIECGGKPNIPLFARICRATGIPFVVVHDSDKRASGRLAPAERALNALIAETAAAEAVIVLDPDFEAVAGLTGHRHKPEHAWREFAECAPRLPICRRHSCASRRPPSRPAKTTLGRHRAGVRASSSPTASAAARLRRAAGGGAGRLGRSTTCPQPALAIGDRAFELAHFGFQTRQLGRRVRLGAPHCDGSHHAPGD
jgi:hypothetical protein